MYSLFDILTFIFLINAGIGLVVAQGNEIDRRERIADCRSEVIYTDTYDGEVNYIAHYNECLEQPVKVKYSIHPNRTPIITRKVDGGRFFTIGDIHTSDNKDYRNNIYDRGHLLPASARRYNRKLYRQTFGFTNVALQVDRLNRGVWRHLEVEVQELSDSLDITIDVVVDILFSDESIKLTTEAAVPVAFRKTFLDKCFIFANSKDAKKELCQQ